ncbi:MAG: hypothetical protein NTW32_11475 [Chloroflexi bacterium]|nr:hypothetical protein [Chloroflexota bacterium]
MKKAVKKLFIWTPDDILAWEKIRQQGFWHFVLRSGLIFFGMILFVLTGGITIIANILAQASIANLLFQLVFVGGVCLLGGLFAGLLTWWLEDTIYMKIKKSRS